MAGSIIKLIKLQILNYIDCKHKNLQGNITINTDRDDTRWYRSIYKLQSWNYTKYYIVNIDNDTKKQYKM